MSLKIIIVGAGEVGYHLASMLSLENHDIVMIESNPEKCRRVKENLDVFVVEGSGASAKVLLDAGTPNSDIIIAVTSIDEINIISCMLAGKFNVRKKIARVRNPEYAGSKPLISPMEFGIDMIIHPEDEAAKEIVRLVKRASASDLIEFENGKIQLLGFHVDSNSPILRVPLKEIGERYSRLTFRTVAITRGKETIIPSGEDYLMDGDRVLIVSDSNSVGEVVKLVGKEEEKVKNVMILGAGKIGLTVARMLEDKYKLKIVESDRDKCELAAKELKRTLIIKGDGTDIDLLKAERISEMNDFIAVTHDEKTNIISGLLAKHLGVGKTIVHITKSDYIPVVNTVGLDAVVSKSLSTIDAILKFVRKGKVLSVVTLEGIDAEVLELIPQEGSKVTEKPLEKCKFPKGAIVAALIHGNEVTVPTGKSRISKGDKVVIFSLPEAISEVEKLFSK